MITSNKALSVFLKLLEKVDNNRIAACSDELRISLARKNNQPIPDNCLPGRLIMALSDSDRDILKHLKANDVNLRIK